MLLLFLPLDTRKASKFSTIEIMTKSAAPMMTENSSKNSQKRLLDKYVDAVMHAPASLCLTATRDPKEFWERHVLDALKMLEVLPKEFHQDKLRVIDVGSGNGIPGIPIAIAVPQWPVTLLDSNNKKCGFLDMFCKFNAIYNAKVMIARAEVIAHDEEYREKFDLVFSRALAKLPSALELCITFAKINGCVIVSCGTLYRKELENSQRALLELGCSLYQVIPYQINRDHGFNLLLFKKDHETPERYPRKTGIPTKRPL